MRETEAKHDPLIAAAGAFSQAIYRLEGNPFVDEIAHGIPLLTADIKNKFQFYYAVGSTQHSVGLAVLGRLAADPKHPQNPPRIESEIHFPITEPRQVVSWRVADRVQKSFRRTSRKVLPAYIRIAKPDSLIRGFFTAYTTQSYDVGSVRTDEAILQMIVDSTIIRSAWNTHVDKYIEMLQPGKSFSLMETIRRLPYIL